MHTTQAIHTIEKRIRSLFWPQPPRNSRIELGRSGSVFIPSLAFSDARRHFERAPKDAGARHAARAPAIRHRLHADGAASVHDDCAASDGAMMMAQPQPQMMGQSTMMAQPQPHMMGHVMAMVGYLAYLSLVNN